MSDHKIDAAWAKVHLDAIRPMVPPAALHSLDCVRSWLSSPLPTHPELAGSPVTFGALVAKTVECNKLHEALELASGYLTDAQVAEIAAAMSA